MVDESHAALKAELPARERASREALEKKKRGQPAYQETRARRPLPRQMNTFGQEGYICSSLRLAVGLESMSH